MGRTMRVAAAIGAIGLLFVLPGLGRGDSTDGYAGLTWTEDPAVPCQTASIGWRNSIPKGRPFKKGRLVNGVQLPAEGDFFFTWDFPLSIFPNQGWRRWGVDGTIREILTVLCEFRLAHPGAPRIGVADIARTRGGKFGPQFGGEGHASHQNGLDVDILYPRLDRIEAAPLKPAQVDQFLAQDLVSRFVALGAKYVFVGPHLHLAGPKGVVVKLVGHDDHLHVRFRRPLVTKPPPPAPGTKPFPLAPPPAG